MKNLIKYTKCFIIGWLDGLENLKTKEPMAWYMSQIYFEGFDDVIAIRDEYRKECALLEYRLREKYKK